MWEILPDPDYVADPSRGSRHNRERLERAMTSAGWIPLPTEWWHFDAPGWERHPLRDEPLRSAATARGD
jgi:D-alanyl-D-alanine dipeptidase